VSGLENKWRVDESEKKGTIRNVSLSQNIRAITFEWPQTDYESPDVCYICVKTTDNIFLLENKVKYADYQRQKGILYTNIYDWLETAGTLSNIADSGIKVTVCSVPILNEIESENENEYIYFEQENETIVQIYDFFEKKAIHIILNYKNSWWLGGYFVKIIAECESKVPSGELYYSKKVDNIELKYPFSVDLNLGKNEHIPEIQLDLGETISVKIHPDYTHKYILK
jgi:hypothetical protein